MKTLRLFLLWIFVFFMFSGLTHAFLPEAAKASTQDEEKGLSSYLFGNLSWRNIGPANMVGRVSDVEGVPGDPNIVYVGTASGGVWKTTNGGTTWEPIFDQQPVSSIGDIALEPGNHDVVYVGTGESNVRNSVSFGNGVYKTTDGGNTWSFLGLKNTKHISRIVINPHNPDKVYVGALGGAFGPNSARGVYVSRDGGTTWGQITLDEKSILTEQPDILLRLIFPKVLSNGILILVMSAKVHVYSSMVKKQIYRMILQISWKNIMRV